MADKRTHYPRYDVMEHEHHWDDHTREIVHHRMETPPQYAKLTGEEVARLHALAALFIDDTRPELLAWIVKHFDAKLTSDIGESQRQPHVPPQKQLIKEGLAALEHLARSEKGASFIELAPEQQTTLLVALEANAVTLTTPEGQQLPAKAFFNKLCKETIAAYYSHPQVWSEIGYGGPAYPRGYVRLEVGLTDPWEARKED